MVGLKTASLLKIYFRIGLYIRVVIQLTTTNEVLIIMKKLITTSLCALTALCFSVSAAAQNAPQTVTNAFTEKYPDAANVEWDYNDDKDEQGYEADFVMKGQRYEALFAEDGTWKQTEKELSRDATFPDGMKQTLKRDYSNISVDDIYELTTPEGTFYKVDLDMETDNDKDEIEYLIFKEDGSLVKEVMDAEDDGWFFN